jgi:succinate-semialdehyde dehydrogenase / glutarate-semialdehyde dehydrogenase
MIRSVNPASGRVIEEFQPIDDSGLRLRLEQAQGAASLWRRTPLDDRTKVLVRAADALRDSQEDHARGVTLEMGKPIRAAREEVAKCERTLRWYADHAADFIAEKPISDDGAVSYEPLGTVLAIMPWNFPYWQVIRFAAPALAGGNVALLKHASNVPRCALALEELFATAGAPTGVFQTLLLEVDSVADVIADERIAAVTLTGSEEAGRSVAATAGRHLKKCVLELGGSDAFIVLADADLAAAARGGARSRTVNSGQSCIAAKRFIVEQPIANEFVTKFERELTSLRVGDPMLEDTDIGPLATAQIRSEVQAQVARTIAQGARLVLGGRSPDSPGYFYEPTLLTGVPFDSPAATEEIFGPVAPVFVVADASEAIALANASRFGLGASIWTGDEQRGRRLAAEIQAGTVFVNGMVASDPRFPFGGIKASGYGRELSVEGMHEFMNIKTVRYGVNSAGSRAE